MLSCRVLLLMSTLVMHFIASAAAHDDVTMSSFVSGRTMRRGGAAGAVSPSGNGTAAHGYVFGHWDNYDVYTMAECTVVVLLTFTAMAFEHVHEWIHHKAGTITMGVETAFTDVADKYDDEASEEEEEEERPTYHVKGARQHFTNLFSRVKCVEPLLPYELCYL